ncbi:MAG: L-seryl-tRNA(Sec) selenium transferase [Christensenellaceae bacterium]|jgi:L-seryl-tRNA(Ser) seleniumtransferase|nr:L-seryl-tRNA(Sec) selenium transferase [Christensenellaceae bacterium]
MDERQEKLRKIPKVDELIERPALAETARKYGRAAVTRAARGVLAQLRDALLSNPDMPLPPADVLEARICELAGQGARPRMRRVINATGVVLHTNIGRAPLAEQALEDIAEAARGYVNIEYDIERGGRGERSQYVAELLRELTGAEAALVVNNNAAAVFLLLHALRPGAEVIVSRGELVEIGAAFRIPDIMTLAGATLREVGTTNRTRARDYEAAICPGQTGALFKVHTSNFKVEGFTEETSLEELAVLGKAHGLPVYYDLGSGTLLPLEPLGIHSVPHIAACIAKGADAVTFSADKLLGGPQAGVLMGKAETIAKLARHPLMRVLRPGKLTLAALESTLRLYRDAGRAAREIPVLAMLHISLEELQAKAERLAERLAFWHYGVRALREEGRAGGGALPTQVLLSAAVELTPTPAGADALEQALRGAEVPIISRIARDMVLLDVRTMDEADFPIVEACLRRVLA